ncbi:transient receptor potential cation channel protein painless isoform X2 [Eurytemora carolleeae]|uniref:transient receptor potential cation channel protein painless isoform X2 n=1 Tax=Eurytemora carolleeae TaxID=1294199 RepID=UPI000C759083|nr:transient receptor potential cation channel protein painless isoform X2 [Eurytemora carolleeae]|eukprot:XP_023328490.1 transient receptor potential cation channel protein painless-like isoform X2 [Eurytemora affinis]
MIEVLMIIFMCFILIFGSAILETCLIILLILLILRELLQTTVSFKRYIFSIENIVEICIISLTIVLITDKDGERFELNRHLAAIVLLLSWGELIVLVGVHPKLKHCNIYVTIFFKVLRTFFWFLAWYSLFIVAFGFGFYIILHQDTGVIQEPEDDPYPFFNQTWLSLVKTSTMFVGELEFSDLPFDLDSPLAPLSYIFFLSFIFLMVVVLMNLLNGLAVSDTGIIREKAEIFSYRSKVETISTLESMLLGDPFDFLSNVPEMVSRIPSCSLLRQLYRNRTLGDLFKKIGSSEILLFYRYLENKQITIKPNQINKTCCRGLREWVVVT